MMRSYMTRKPERAYENQLLAGRETTTGMYATTRTEPLEWSAPSLTDIPSLTSISGDYVLMPGGDGKGPRGGGRRDGSGGGSGGNQGGGRGGNRGGGGGKKTGGGRGGC